MDETCTTLRGRGFQATWVPAATWVCRRWREVALATPQLWSSIDINVRHCDADAINILFERAKDEDLSVSIDGAALDMPTACALVQPNVQRISHLTIHLEESQASTVDALLLNMGPKLDTLQLFCTAIASESILTIDPQTVPNLRALTIDSIFVQPTATLESVRDLTLENLWGVSSVDQKLEVYLYKLLSSCPNLEGLDMTNALPGAHHLDSASIPTLEFPKLRCFWVSELAGDLPENLAHIIIPPSASVSITARYDECPPEWDDESAVLPMDVLPATKFENMPALAQTQDLSLLLGARCCVADIEISGGNWTVSVPSLEDVANGTNRLPEYADHVLEGLPEMVVPAQIVYLQLHIAQHMPEYEDWAGLLGQFPNVVGFTIGGRRAFRNAIEAMRAHGTELLPNLVQLTVCLVASLNVGTRMDARAFGTWLKGRADGGKPLESLVVKVPEMPLNPGTFHLAGSLVAYVAVRGGRVHVEREACVACHGKYDHRDH